MAFSTCYLTIQGVALAAKVLAGDALQITRVVGASGADQGLPFSEVTSLGSAEILFQTLRGIIYSADAPNRVTIPIYYNNNDLPASVLISEIGVFAADPDEGEILLCIIPGYDAPLSIASVNDGHLEVTMDVMIELMLAPGANIVLPPSMIFITRPEADALYAPKKHRHWAEEVDESVGRTVEEHQRWQDAELLRLRDVTESGTTSAITMEIDTLEPLKWRIVNHNGWYDRAKACFRA